MAQRNRLHPPVESHIRPGSWCSADLCFPTGWGRTSPTPGVVFGFDGGERVVFSLEIRKERHESFLGGRRILRQFEQILVAADGRETLCVRAATREAKMFISIVSADESGGARALFLGF